MLTANDKELLIALKAALSHTPIKTAHLGLIVGPANTGKTHFFNQTALELNQTLIGPNLELNIWSSLNAVFIELPKEVLVKGPLQHAFLKHLKKLRRNKGLDSLLVFMDIYQAIQEPPKQFVEFLKSLQQQLTFLIKPFKNTPRLHLIFTHLDKIAGFCHSFEKTADAWGYHFSPYLNHASLLKQNTQSYGALLKNLHHTLIPKLHQAKDELSRYLIREFPLQMESMANMIKACVKHLFLNQAVTSGVYFTSATQGNFAHDRLSTNIAQTYELVISQQIPQSSLDRPYFVEGTLQQILYQANVRQTKHSPIYLRWSAAATLMLSVGIGLQHYHNQQLIHQATTKLTRYAHAKGSSLDTLVPALGELYHANTAMEKMQGVLPLKNIQALKKKMHEDYLQTLHTAFLPQLAQQIEAELSANKSPKETYQALKAYLMLGMPQTMQPTYLLNWFDHHWQSHHVPNKTKLFSLLKQSLQQPYAGITVDEHLIEASRSYLLALPTDYLYFQLISDELPTKSTTIDLAHFNVNQLVVPEIYQKKNFTEIYQQALPKLIAHYEHDAFVLKRQLKKITRLVQTAYLQNYQLYWQKVAQQLSPRAFNNYQEGALLLASFTAKGSPLKSAYQLLHENTLAYTSPHSAAEKAFNQTIASQFTGLNLITPHQLSALQPVLTDLHHYFKTLETTGDAPKSAFEIARSRFLSHGIDPLSQLMEIKQQLPAPLSDWVNAIASNAWSVVLKDAQLHINQQWNGLVYTAYLHDIRDHFPFGRHSSKEVSKEKFTEFFGPYGKIKQFFDFYLSPFIDTTTANWKPRTQDGLQLPLSELSLKELIRANVIREIFFKQHSLIPNVKFSLHALALEPIIDQLTIDIDGQLLSETQDLKQSQEFIWPGNAKQGRAQLKVKTSSGDVFNVSESGFWSLFKLLHKANVKQTNEELTNFSLEFDVNGNASHFLLVAETPLNPFIPGMLEDFHLPDKIS